MTLPADTSVGVIDLGSARAKLTLASSTSGDLTFERSVVEIGIRGALDKEGSIPPELEHELATVIRKFRDHAKMRNVSHLFAVATEVYRSATNGEAVLDRMGQLVGNISLLTASDEGRLFYSATKDDLPYHLSSCAVDIGGGSVQIIWGDQSGDLTTLPIGTYALEVEFQQDHGPPSSQTYDRIRGHVRQPLKASIPLNLRRDVIVMGSNTMRDFMDHAMRFAFGHNNDADLHAQLNVKVVERLFAEIAGKPYDSLDPYYPGHERFMRGADKALIIATELASLVSADTILPTNESVSTSICRLALTANESLLEFGINGVYSDTP